MSAVRAEGVDGVGAMRAFRTGRAITRVRITALQAPTTLRYEGVENPAMTDYTAIVELTPTGTGGTRVSWRGRYLARRGLRPRWSTERRVAQLMQAMADGLAAHAQTRAG